ncbi:hypothetical protein BDY19DRAFT_164213 [Irpex rosettiformis]|uniref:Uncharacterized protein n=1 Tax=Irpex rosettiformis TaxID=378272 RepID=A0ACB8U4Y2_9APHY|nr:hypothetical protein BDY19DRAFT_164213 [Irpex rosettiformis]
MQPTKNPTLLFVSTPGPDEQIDPDIHFELVNKELDLKTACLGGGVLIKTLLLSSEPYLRYRFRNPSDKSDAGFIPPVQLGFPVDSAGIGKVIRSDDPCFQVGDIVIGYLDYSEYCIYPGPGPHLFKIPMHKLNPHPGIPYSVYLGVLGFPGHVAYCAWELYVKERIQSAKRMYVSSGASTVGTFVIEYTKLKAPHVEIVASAGTDEKVDCMKKSGADVVFNYRSEDIQVMLSKHGPIDIFWDNVGGRTLDMTLVNMSEEGLILSCGNISTMSSSHEIQNYDQVYKRKLTVQGVICYAGDMAKPMSTFFQDVVPLVLDGTISHREHLYHGMEEAARALCDLHTGANMGKAVVVVCDDEDEE